MKNCKPFFDKKNQTVILNGTKYYYKAISLPFDLTEFDDTFLLKDNMRLLGVVSFVGAYNDGEWLNMAMHFDGDINYGDVYLKAPHKLETNLIFFDKLALNGFSLAYQYLYFNGWVLTEFKD